MANRANQVDFLLLAGDLFHENYPSKYTLRQTMALLREFTQGERPVKIELLSDPDEGKVGDWECAHGPAAPSAVSARNR